MSDDAVGLTQRELLMEMREDLRGHRGRLRAIVSIRLTPSAYAHGSAVALPTKVAVVRPTGVGRGIATDTIPIEGRDEWLAAAGLRA